MSSNTATPVVRASDDLAGRVVELARELTVRDTARFWTGRTDTQAQRATLTRDGDYTVFLRLTFDRRLRAVVAWPRDAWGNDTSLPSIKASFDLNRSDFQIAGDLYRRIIAKADALIPVAREKLAEAEADQDAYLTQVRALANMGRVTPKDLVDKLDKAKRGEDADFGRFSNHVRWSLRLSRFGTVELKAHFDKEMFWSAVPVVQQLDDIAVSPPEPPPPPDPEEVPRALRYYAALRAQADVVHRVSPFDPGAHPVPFSYDASFTARPLAYARPGPVVAVLRLRRCTAGPT